jgi:hypothetical protein
MEPINFAVNALSGQGPGQMNNQDALRTKFMGSLITLRFLTLIYHVYIISIKHQRLG